MSKPATRKILDQWRGYKAPDDGRAVRSFSELVPAVLAKLGLEQRFRESSIQDCWPELMGDFVASHTRPAGLQRNVLTVEVDHSAWLHELSLLHKKIMLQKLCDQFPNLKIRDLRFRLRG